MNALAKLSSICFKTPSKASMVRGITTSDFSQGFFSRGASKNHGHSSLLAGDVNVYEMVIDAVPPKDWSEYLRHQGDLIKLCNDKGDHAAQHLASFRYIYGERVFRAMHLYVYPNGWSDVDKTRIMTRSDQAYMDQHRKGLNFITQRTREFLKSFSFWPTPTQRSGNNIYDLRSYQLKPGSMYDWGHYWAKGITYRKQVREDIPYGGFFTQIGQLQLVHHLWVYKDLNDRNNCRTKTWDTENWPEVVSNTVPLVSSMKTRILEPLPFSPTQ